MAHSLVTYLQDHLAGARFAVSMLEDLRERGDNSHLVELAEELLPEISADRAELEQLAAAIGEGASGPKEAVAWIAQKASRYKMAPDDRLGAFEMLEMLCLGVQGKLALWNALKTLKSADDRLAHLDLDRLVARALAQHGRAEKVRLELAPNALSGARP